MLFGKASFRNVLDNAVFNPATGVVQCYRVDFPNRSKELLICDKSRRGDFRIRRKSRRDRMCAKLREIKEGLRHRMHRPIPETGKWLAQIVAGYFAYHAVPTNSRALSAFRYHVLVLWQSAVMSAQPKKHECYGRA